MKNLMEVLRSKEQEIIKVKKEIEALRIAAPLLNDEVQFPSPQVPGVPQRNFDPVAIIGSIHIVVLRRDLTSKRAKQEPGR